MYGGIELKLCAPCYRRNHDYVYTAEAAFTLFALPATPEACECPCHREKPVPKEAYGV